MKKGWIASVCAASLMMAACSAAKPHSAGKPEEKPESWETEDITGMNFVYDNFSGNQFYLEALTEDISPEGCTVHIVKRVGPMNYTGHKKEGDFALSAEKTAELLEIIGRYDIAAWSKLPTNSSGSSPTRRFGIYLGDVYVGVPWNARFPKTLPPQEDIMYCELFNFFNGLIRETEGWEEVVSEDLDDPRDNPAYGPRTVIQYGKEVSLVPGTGVWYESGKGALIDYGDRKWWLEEGFTGSWHLQESGEGGSAMPGFSFGTGGTVGVQYGSAVFTVTEDGSCTLELNEDTWSGRLSEKRYYLSEITASVEKESEERVLTIWPAGDEDYEQLHISCYPGPVPEPQFPPIDVTVVR